MADENLSAGKRQAHIDQTRAELSAALNEIEDRVNPAKVAQRTADRAKASFESNPTPWFAAAAGATVVVVGGVLLAIFGGRR
ncbi:DUF3618 domain-containing protein [Humidisolicoccus flavus]|uniref:DUF3618 domain-containing protein n=1 Tax=Humidisolicoccus flavus TaxID=3111414 RepID=UPI003254BD96